MEVKYLCNIGHTLGQELDWDVISKLVFELCGFISRSLDGALCIG